MQPNGEQSDHPPIYYQPGTQQTGLHPPQQQVYLPQTGQALPHQQGYHPSYLPQQMAYPPQQPGYFQHPIGYPPNQIPGYQHQLYPSDASPAVYPAVPPAPFQLQPNGELLAGNVCIGLPPAPATWMRKSNNPKVQISLSAKKLKNRDLTSKSDPLAVIFIYDVPTERWYEAGRTESIMDNLNPEWATKIDVDYFFEEEQKIRIEVYDRDSNSSKLKNQDFLGKVETKLSSVVAAKGSTKNMDLKSFSKLVEIESTITIWAEQLSSCRDIYTFQFAAKKLDNKDVVFLVEYVFCKRWCYFCPK